MLISHLLEIRRSRRGGFQNRCRDVRQNRVVPQWQRSGIFCHRRWFVCCPERPRWRASPLLETHYRRTTRQNAMQLYWYDYRNN